MPPKTQPSGVKRKASDRNKSDLDDDFSPYSSQSSHASASLRSDELEHLVNECVYYILISHQKRLPVKKADIVKHVLKEHSKSFSNIIPRVEAVLKQVYGIKLVEVEGKKGHYILVNNLKEGVENIQISRMGSDTENAKDGLLVVILTLIFMNGNVMAEGHMWQTLKRLGLTSDGPKCHPVFGDIKKLITYEFVRQLYLEHIRIPGSDPPSHEFRWGARSQLEVDKKELLELVCVIFNNEMKIEQWSSQYHDMLRSSKDNPDSG